MRMTIKKSSSKMMCGGKPKKMANGGDPKKPTKKQSDMMKATPKKLVLMSTGPRPKLNKISTRPIAKMQLGGIVGGGDGLKKTKSSTDCWNPGGGSSSGKCKTGKGKTPRGGGGHPDLVPVKKKSNIKVDPKKDVRKFN